MSFGEKFDVIVWVTVKLSFSLPVAEELAALTFVYTVRLFDGLELELELGSVDLLLLLVVGIFSIIDFVGFRV